MPEHQSLSQQPFEHRFNYGTIPTHNQSTETSPGHKSRDLPLCWGHRGHILTSLVIHEPLLACQNEHLRQASADFPENTLCSFKAAIQSGAEGIESDVRISADDVIMMIHDPSLGRTTDGQGKIDSLPYVGGLDAIRTLKAPHQKIPTFDETIDLLMLKENQHVTFNIDCKPTNDPERLFNLIKASIERFQDHALLLSPRLVLGMYHPKFLEPAARLLPDLKRIHIGVSPSMARNYFWEACEGFSMKFSCLVGWEGLLFRKDCQKAGKSIMVWTVNDRQEMIEACKWGVDAILTDQTKYFLALRQQMKADWSAVAAETSALFPYTSIHYNGLVSWLFGRLIFYYLYRLAGPFKPMKH
ncbi:hypothetical protein PSHT_06722 [Puccinia striiformis]|uniref:GP-PDE domain-containing protein n=1 Tax=Puccinia striiformis TaxID=27350 RepID=A0A2S4W3Q1_9BASI|nr:hypothetical protein PSHT_06722 [Puccinia striiformis]